MYVLAEDFNAKVGRESQTWRDTICKFGWGDMNDIGEQRHQYGTAGDLKIMKKRNHKGDGHEHFPAERTILTLSTLS